MDVLGFGESSRDSVYVVDELPHAGTSKLRIVEHYSGCGGQVATTMAACAAFGLRAGYLGPVGSDENGLRLRDELQTRGVETSRLIARDARTRYAIIIVERRGGDRVVLWERDAALDVDPRELTLEHLSGAQVVHVDATDEPASIRLAELARGSGTIVTCDVDSVTARTAELLSHVSVPILAERVPRQLTGITDVEQALRTIRASHPGLLCVTLGERGAAALDGDTFMQVPARPVRAVDTTSAGDVFRAGFIHGLIAGWPVVRTLRFANSAAAVSCTRRGAMESIPRLHELEHLR
jgi:sugar/nucleoside kinase (ribokinase family)